MLCGSGYFNPEAGASLQADAEELIKLLAAIIKTTKTRS
ncbi:MAG: hypothetical protein ACPH3N_01600 [Alcanivorax sediminis]